LSDTITVIRARARRLAKIVHRDGTIQGFDSARTFDLFSVPVADLEATAKLLDHLLHRPDCAVVRGNIIDPARTKQVRRLALPDPKTGECPTLQEAAHQWLALDLDNAERPASIPADDLAGCAAMAVSRLPAAFCGVSCIAQASGSHGLVPGIRLRLWYWLSRPASGPELKRWLRGVAVDHSVFRPAQVIYTAAPIFEPGAIDPLLSRIAHVAGESSAVLVPSPAMLAPAPSRPMPTPAYAGGNRYAFAALTNAAVRVASKSQGQRHDTLLAEAQGLARFVAARLLTERDVRDTLGAAGQQVGKPRDEIDNIITWAMAHPRASTLPERVR
jgi:hypothetical protein